MKHIKRILAVFLILAMWLSLTACGSDTATSNHSGTATTVTTATEGSTTASSGGVSGITVYTTDITVNIGKLTTTVKPTPGATTTTTTTAKPIPSDTTTTTAPLSTEQMLVDAAFLLQEDETLQGDVSLTGTVTYIKEISESYGNATFEMQVYGSDGPKTILCYRVKPAEGWPLEFAVGDQLKVIGTIQNYRGTIEFSPAVYRGVGVSPTTTTTTTRPTGSGSAAIAEDGIYDSKEDVALYLHTYGKLPKNYVTKSQYNKDKYLCVGGDRFYNKEGLLPNKAGRLYYECDIDTYGSTSRGAKRIVFSNDGLVYYTGDHYKSFTLLYGTP